jgi:hypothetical protein
VERKGKGRGNGKFWWFVLTSAGITGHVTGIRARPDWEWGGEGTRSEPKATKRKWDDVKSLSWMSIAAFSNNCSLRY